MHRDSLWKTTKQSKDFDDVWFYLCDHLGTPQEITDHTGAIIWKAEYKAWGECKTEKAKSSFFENSEIISNNIRFQGQYFDEETGLHYNRYRYYSPYVGRFISKDPIGLWGGINVYQYASSSISWVDPLGLQKSGKQKQGSAKPEEGTPKKTCPHSNVVNALENFQTKRYQFGSNTYILDKAAMTHILKRHHPEYWDGSIKSTQSFLCPSLSITQIETEIKAVLQANREKLAESGQMQKCSNCLKQMVE